jgi:hypothetical protein
VDCGRAADEAEDAGQEGKVVKVEDGKLAEFKVEAGSCGNEDEGQEEGCCYLVIELNFGRLLEVG